MSRTTQVLGFSVPPALVQEVEALATRERRTKSELFREMVRVYGQYCDQRDRDENRWVMQVVAEAQREEAENPMSQEDRLRESRRLAAYGAKQARNQGVPTEAATLNRIIHERRTARRNP